MEDLFMKSVWKKIGLALIALTLSSQAMALILIEPYGGYDFSLSGETKGATTEKFDFSGAGYGGRLGLTLARIMFGVQYDMMNLDFEPEGGTKYSVDQTNLGAFVGWSPVLDGFRFWGEYFFDVKNDVENSGENSGDGWGVGIGYKFMKFLALNAEYRSWSMDEASGGGSMDQTGDSIFVTVSLPFDIL
jgi:hypothetical protein